jgi:hypothetical protein
MPTLYPKNERSAAPQLIASCPRCPARNVAFHVTQVWELPREYDWQYRCEAFCICSNCSKSTTFVLEQKVSSAVTGVGMTFSGTSPLQLQVSLNNYFNIAGFVSLKDRVSHVPPEHLPEETKLTEVFREGATCCAVQCWNAAGTMFRKCVDIATASLLPREEAPSLNSKTRRDLGLRLKWLFDNGRLPESLRDLSTCIHQDGNDAAHAQFLTKQDAEDLLDFTEALLTRLYTEPRQLELARERREQRRATPATGAAT